MRMLPCGIHDGFDCHFYTWVYKAFQKDINTKHVSQKIESHIEWH